MLRQGDPPQLKLLSTLPSNTLLWRVQAITSGVYHNRSPKFSKNAKTALQFLNQVQKITSLTAPILSNYNSTFYAVPSQPSLKELVH